MIEIQILEKQEPGYDKPTYSWDCQLCSLHVRSNLLLSYVSARALDHVLEDHIADRQSVKVVVIKEKDTNGQE